MHSEVMEKTCHQRRKLLQNNNQIFPPAAEKWRGKCVLIEIEY